MTDVPSPTLYHRSMGWHAPALRRTAIVGVVGVAAMLGSLWMAPWQLAVPAGWTIAAVVFLTVVWRIILHTDGPATRLLATVEDDTRSAATALAVGASTASLLAVGFALVLAGDRQGTLRLLLIVGALTTVACSWTVINTMFTLRYAHLHYTAGDAGIGFGEPAAGAGDACPDYRDFAYVAFTVGMCYQVSDTTLRDRRVRRTVLVHALVSYLFGVVIVAGAINLVAGMVR